MTKLQCNQLEGAKMPEPNVLLLLPDGTSAQVILGPGIDLVDGEPGGKKRLIVRRPTTEVPKQEEPALVYRLTSKGTALQVWRNGLRQSEGIDYTTDGETITFAEFYADDPHATIIVDYLPI